MKDTMNSLYKILLVLTCVVAGAATSGCSSHQTTNTVPKNTDTAPEKDPLENINRKVFGFNDVLDKVVLKPAAKGYRAITPQPVETGVHNFFANLLEVRNVANDLFQAKWKRAGLDSSRFLINSVFGIAGLVDVAGYAGIKRAEGEDFGQTLRVWGLPDGAYIIVPFMGSYTVTDLVAAPIDWVFSPMTYVSPSPEKIAALGLNSLDTRLQLLDAEELVTGDKYLFIREAYIQNRNFKAKDGEVEDDFGGDLDSFDDF